MNDWNGHKWWIPPSPAGWKEPRLSEQLRSARWVLLVVTVVIDGLAGYRLWMMLGEHHVGSIVAAWLGFIGLGLLNLLAAVLALYLWWMQCR